MVAVSSALLFSLPPAMAKKDQSTAVDKAAKKADKLAKKAEKVMKKADKVAKKNSPAKPAAVSKAVCLFHSFPYPSMLILA